MRPKTTPGGRSGPTFTEVARRAQIIACGIETIAEVGYANASLAEIARRAGTSKSVISYHFAGKDDLIRQIVATVVAEGTAFMQSRIGAASSSREMLGAYIRSNLAFMRSHRAHIIAIVEIFTGFRDGDGRTFLDPADYAAGLEPLERILLLGQDQGDFRPFSTRIMAITLRSAIDAVPPQLAADPGLDLDEYAAELERIFAAACGTDGRGE